MRLHGWLGPLALLPLVVGCAVSPAPKPATAVAAAVPPTIEPVVSYAAPQGPPGEYEMTLAEPEAPAPAAVHAKAAPKPQMYSPGTRKGHLFALPGRK